jgi:hypothetical protein
VVVAAELTQQANDVQQLVPMLTAIRTTLASASADGRRQWLAVDSCYWSISRKVSRGVGGGTGMPASPTLSSDVDGQVHAVRAGRATCRSDRHCLAPVGDAVGAFILPDATDV